MNFLRSKNVFFWLLLPFTFILGCSKDVPPPLPIAAFTVNATNFTAPSTVSFTNSSTNATGYIWDFGDGSTSYANSPSHTYTNGGTFIVKLTATGTREQSFATKTLTITNPTSLQISVKDNLGNPVIGATVKLYDNQNDWINETNQLLTTQVSNSSGIVTFKPLTTKTYYWKITNGCQNNIYTTSTSSSSLTGNVTNLITTILGSTGTLALNNTSANPYDIYINGTLQFAMAGGARRDLLVPTGVYSIRVLQKSGFLLTPTDRTYTGTLLCGGTLTTTFP